MCLLLRVMQLFVLAMFQSIGLAADLAKEERIVKRQKVTCKNPGRLYLVMTLLLLSLRFEVF